MSLVHVQKTTDRFYLLNMAISRLQDDWVNKNNNGYMMVDLYLFLGYVHRFSRDLC